MQSTQSVRHTDNTWILTTSEAEVTATVSPPVPTPALGESTTYRLNVYGMDHVERYNAIRDLRRCAGDIVVHQTPTSRWFYTDQTRDETPSPLIQIRPDYQLLTQPDGMGGYFVGNEMVTGLWGVVTSISNESIDEFAVGHIDLSIIPLDDADVYETHPDAESELRMRGP